MTFMERLFNSFYNNKTVLVTGHTGFKGSWLSIWLREMGAKVVGYALDPYTEKDNFVLAKLQDKIVDIRGDIRDIDKLSSVFETYKPEVVFHLAAQPIVRVSYETPRETFEQNVMGTVNVLECVKKYDFVKVCVCITSDKCYDNKEWLWGYRENDAMGGRDPYSASKGCSELVISSYINSFFEPDKYDKHKKAVASVRAGNVIGGGDWSKDRIIPDCIKAIELNKPIEVRNPKAVRPWQHVLEPLSGYLLLASVLQTNPNIYSGGWNFGPNIEAIITVEKIVNKLITDLNKGSWVDKPETGAPHEAKLLNLDCSKAFNLLKWKPMLNIDECIKFVADWYANYKNTDVYNLCKTQIESYVKHAKDTKNEWAG